MCLLIYTFSATLGLLYCLIIPNAQKQNVAQIFMSYFYLGGVEVFLITELLINHVDFSICCCAIVFSLKYEWLHQDFFLISYVTANEREIDVKTRARSQVVVNATFAVAMMQLFYELGLICAVHILAPVAVASEESPRCSLITLRLPAFL